MEIINNRYRVVKCINQNNIVSSYVVNDIIKNYDTIQLNMLNSECIEKNLIEFYTREFPSLTNICCKNIISVYDFALVNLLDNKRLNDKVYFYTNEFVQNNSDILGITRHMESQALLDLFIEICQSINYLHLKGFIYGDINLSNIITSSTEDNKEYYVAFKDMATVELEKRDFWKKQNNQDYFIAPEVLEGNKCSILSDIYSLGVLLFIIYINSKNHNCSIEEEDETSISNIVEDTFNNNADFDINFKIIIEKMINVDATKRYGSISQLVMDINSSFYRKYVSYRKQEVEKLNFNFKIIGRDEEVNKVISTYESIKDKNSYNSTVLIHGESGIGKTRFLKEVRHLFSLNKVKGYSSFVLDVSTKNSNKALLEILKQFISECEPEVLERYESELVKFIPELGGKKVIIPSEPLSGDKERFRLIHSIVGFIEACIINIPIVIIIDNFHLADDFTVEVVEYLTRKRLLNKNIMMVMSYCDGECVLNKKFIEFIENVTSRDTVTNIFLKELSEPEVGRMIQSILSTPKALNKFADSIYDRTKGNPLFVGEVIKSFFNKKYIYIDEEKGYWTKDYDYSKFIIPSDMHEVLINQVKEMGELNYNILKIISIFKSGVSLGIITKFIVDKDVDLGKTVEELVSAGILCRKIEDKGFVFDFYNKFLKSLMYERITDEYREDMHRLAAQLLESRYTKGDMEYIEELIYHLEKSRQVEKVIDYCIENAEKMKLLKNRNGAISNLTKAVSIMDCSKDFVKNIKLIMELAELHEQEGHIDLAISYYLSVQNCSNDIAAYKYIIDSLIKVAATYLTKNNIDNSVHYIKEVQSMLEKVDYVGGILKSQGILASIYDKKQDYERVQAICHECLVMCVGEYEELKAIFYHYKGVAYIRSGRTEEALVIFQDNMEICKKYSNISVLVKSLNNIGVIYADYYQDDSRAIKYFQEIKAICERNNMGSSEVDALINIGASYFSKEQYEVSLEYFIETLEKCKKYEYEFHIFYCYNSIASVYLKLGDYANSYKYYELCNKELEIYPDQGKDIGEFYFLAAEINYKLGDLKKAQSYIDSALSIYKNDDSIFKWRVQILNEYIKFYFRENDDGLMAGIERIITLANKILYTSNRLNIFYDIIIFLHENHKIECIPIIFNEIKKIQINIKEHRAYSKKLYIDGILDKKKSIKSLNAAIECSKEYKVIDICWKAYTAMGDHYYDKKDYLNAVIYYFEACGILKDIILRLPLEYRLSFVRRNNALRPFTKFLGINNYYQYNKDPAMLEFMADSAYDEEGLTYVLEQVNHKDILKNKSFIKSIKRMYSASLHEDIHDINDVLQNLESDNVKNLELIIDYLSYVTLATRGTIIISDGDNGYKVIASSDRSYELPQTQEGLSKTFSREKYALLMDCPQEQYTNVEGNRIHNTLKASICIPIILENISEEDFVKNERRKGTRYNKQVLGYVYIESHRVLNNINKESMKKCMELSKIIGVIIEKYKLKLSASIDKLTGTLTRKYLEQSLNEQIQIASQKGGKFSIIMYDLDHFKMVNDKFGHRTGDYALKKVCEVVMGSLRETDMVGRYGGEEFIVILPDTDIEDAQLVAEKLRSKIELQKIMDNKQITVSLGVATYPLHGEWQDELVERVDQALYVAKHQGRNRYAVWNSQFSKKAKRTDKLSGIISGNAIQDHRNVLAMIELIEIINASSSREDKIYSLLGRIIEITEAQKGILLIVENGAVIDRYSRIVLRNEWTKIDTYNEELIESVMETKQGVCKIDWDTISEYDTVTGVPNWQSVMVVPLIQGDTVKGILYLTESTTIKEFRFEDFNFVNILGKIIIPIL